MGKTIVITGANKGIGRATAELLVQDGHQLVLASRSIDNILYLQEEYPNRILVQQCDVRDRQAVMALVDLGMETFKSVDVLVNNAGVGGFGGLAEADPDEWDRMIDINIKGVLYAIHAVLPHMLAQDSGHIINIASVAAHHVYPKSVVYAATKHAVRAISEGLRLELRDTVRTTTISPGAVNTSFPEEIENEEMREHFREMLSNGLSAERIAACIKQCIDYPNDVNMTEMIIRPN